MKYPAWADSARKVSSIGGMTLGRRIVSVTIAVALRPGDCKGISATRVMLIVSGWKRMCLGLVLGIVSLESVPTYLLYKDATMG